MPTPNDSGPVSFVYLTGTNLIDSLLGGAKWGGAAGSGATVSFSFPNLGYWSLDPSTGYGPSSGDGEPWNSFDLTSAQQSVFRTALQRWANVANITFSESVDNQSTVGDIRVAFTYNMRDPSLVAFAWFPNIFPPGGDIWLDANDYFTTFSNLNFGSYGFFTLLHEIGHTLGLKHPFDTLPWNSNTLPEQYDAWHYTVMSYEGVPGSPLVAWTYQPTTPMRFDIEALQYLYGPNLQFHAGDDVYTYYAGQNYFETIWDAGGNDTIQYVATSDPAEIDLRPGALSNLGNTLYTQDFLHSSIYTVVIYDTVVIENAIGGDGPDLVYGNDAANSLEGRGGADTILGGAGDDSIEGGAGNDRLEGGAGNDRFDWDESSRGGADTMYGGPGNDTYVIDSLSSDVVVELAGEGTDVIWAGQTYSIANVANVENLSLFGTQSANATGNALNNVITGNSGNNTLNGDAGNDTLNGGAGNDTLDGGAGNDTYLVDSMADTITELAGGGTDTVQSSVSFTLAALGQVENLILSGAAATGTGNAGNNVLTGNASNNTLTGLAGNDTLDGGAGIDTAIFTGNRASYANVRTFSGFTVSGPDGSDTLTSIERLQFSDKKVALDLGSGQAAANTVRIIGAAFDAPAIQQHPDYVGIGLNRFDAGNSMVAVCQLAISAMGPLTNTAFVNTVYQNVVGVLPSAAERGYYVGLLVGNGGTMTQAALLVLAANADVNAVNINLVGLQQSGVEFI